MRTCINMHLSFKYYISNLGGVFTCADFADAEGGSRFEDLLIKYLDAP